MWGELLNFAKDNASWLAPAAGAIGGALLGGRDQTTTQTSAPNLPDNYKKGYDKLLSDADAIYARGHNARQTMRPETGGNAFQQLFQNPQMQVIQAQDDAQYAGGIPAMMASQYAAQSAAQAPQAAQSTQTSAFPAMSDMDMRMVNLQRMYQTDPNDMSPLAQEKRRKLLQLSNMKDFKDGDVNKYTGATFNRADQLKFLEDEANFNMMRPRNSFGFQGLTEAERAPMQEQRDSLYSQVYQPSKSKNSFLGKFGVPLLMAGLTGGAGLLAPASALAGTGSTALTGANIAKNAFGLAPSLRG